jgi:hypothetical protein
VAQSENIIGMRRRPKVAVLAATDLKVLESLRTPALRAGN